MNGLKFPVGISNFAKIRDEGYYYIDKTNLITEILESGIAEVTLITRPRRFGKTLGMSMLADFFDVRKDSSKHFAGLSVSKNTHICNQWMNRYPTIFVSLKETVSPLMMPTLSSLCSLLIYTRNMLFCLTARI